MSTILMMLALGPPAVLPASGDPTPLVSARFLVANESQAREINAKLARVALPEFVRLDPGESVPDMVGHRCGFVDDAIVNTVRLLNPALQELPVDGVRVIQVPPCTYFRPGLKVTVAEGQGLGALLRIATGFEGPTTIGRTLKLNPHITDPEKIPAHTEILLPYETRAISFRVRPEYAVATRLFDSFFGRKSEAAEVGGLTLISEPASVNDADRIACANAPADWPIDTSRLSKLLRRYRSYAIAREEAFVAVVDTGLPKDAIDYLPLAVSERERGAPAGADGDENTFPNDIVGISMAKGSGYPLAPPVAEFFKAGHGMQVASVASGVALLDEGVHPVKIKSIAVLNMRLDGTVPRWEATDAELRDALNYAKVTRPEPSLILNWSWEGAKYNKFLEGDLELSGQLVIIAAGNDGVDLEDSQEVAYPATYSKTRKGNVLTVAALRPDTEKLWRIAEFSNYGATTVNIAAPGCAIPTIEVTGLKVLAEGTSFASPLVAFTAGLIQAFGIKDMQTVRDRILTTAEVDPDLVDFVRDGRVLQMEQAVALYDDIVLPRDGTAPLYGLILGEVDFDKLAGSREGARIRRVDFVGPGAEGLWRVVFHRQDRGKGVDRLPAKSIALTFLEIELAESGERMLIPVADVKSIIPRYFNRPAPLPDKH